MTFIYFFLELDTYTGRQLKNAEERAVSGLKHSNMHFL